MYPKCIVLAVSVVVSTFKLTLQYNIFEKSCILNALTKKHK